MSEYSVGDTERICLDLFAGLGGFSAAFEESVDWRVVTVDLEERFDPDIQADIMDLRPDDLPDADVVLASPPCKCFSKAAAWNDHWDENGRPQTAFAKESVALVFHTLGLIEAISPEFWFMENPEGHLRRFVGRPTDRVTYCQYGAEYMKPTLLWGEHPPMTYRQCRNGDPCHRSSPRTNKAGDGQHPADALPRDPAKRAKVPRELSEEILRAVEGRLQYEQATLLSANGGRQEVER